MKPIKKALLILSCIVFLVVLFANMIVLCFQKVEGKRLAFGHSYDPKEKE
jgi:hypothetical protein